jgi:hypothetical protein
VPVYDQWLSVFLRQHDGYYALGDGWIGRIKGMHRQSGIVIIDLEKDRVALDLERAKVMFFVWIIGAAKVVVDFDRLDDARDCFGAERNDAYRHDRMALAEILSQLVVESSNAVGLC